MIPDLWLMFLDLMVSLWFPWLHDSTRRAA